jgi:hypothetical protein
MRKFIACSAAVAAGLLALPSVAAPQLPEKPRWEYAELSYRGGRAARAKDDTEIPAVQPVIRWTTGEGEIEAKSWTELGEKLKAPSFKKDASATLQRIQLLNYLGSEGWEMVGQQGTSTPAAFGPPDRVGPATTLTGSGTWTFKRRAR